MYSPIPSHKLRQLCLCHGEFSKGRYRATIDIAASGDAKL